MTIQRYYFTQTAASGVDPTAVAYHASWQYTTEASQFRLATTKGASALAVGTLIGPHTANQKALDRRYYSDDLPTGTIFSTSDTFKCQLLGLEGGGTDNVNLALISIRVVNEDGTVKATLKAPGNYFANVEFATTQRNVRFSDTTGGADGNNTLSAGYTSVANDRLEVCIGATGSAAQTTPEFQYVYGENATDLLENETATANGAGWFEITSSVASNVTILPPAANLTVAGVNPLTEIAALPPAKGMTATGQNPLNEFSVFPPVKGLTLGKNNPTFEIMLPPPAKALALAGLACLLEISLIAPASGLVMTGQIPTISTGALILPGASSLTLAPQNPTFYIELPAPEKSITMTGQIPVLEVAVYPPTAGLTLTAQLPSILTDTLISVPTALLSITGENPSFEIIVPAPAKNLTATGQAPSLYIELIPPSGSLTLEGQIPDLLAGGGVTISVPLGALALSPQIPALSLSVLPPVRTLVLSSLVPTTEITLPAPVQDISLQSPIPTVWLTINCPVGSLALSPIAPAMSVSILPGAASLVMTGHAPAIFSEAIGVVIMVPVATLTFGFPEITIVYSLLPGEITVIKRNVSNWSIRDTILTLKRDVSNVYKHTGDDS